MSGFDRAFIAVLLLMLALPCGACRQTWTFARPDEPTTTNPSAATGPAVGSGQSASTLVYRVPLQPADPAAGSLPVRDGSVALSGNAAQQQGSTQPAAGANCQGQAAPPPQRSPLLGTSFETAAAEWPGMPGEQTPSGAVWQPPGGPVFDPPLQAIPEAPAVPPEPDDRLCTMWQEAKHNVWSDYRHYYSWTTFRDLGLALAIAAPIANTQVDQHFRDWYQRDVRSSESNHLADFWKPFGNGYIMLPGFAGLALAGRYFEDVPVVGPVGGFSNQVTRAYLVGAPPMLLLQYGLGASRPGISDIGSYWRPFHADHGVSGHAFVAAVPFITAANLVENPWAKGTLYALSTFTAWSRINDDGHYLTQACLGWWMGYLACRAVDAAQREDKAWIVTPIATPEMVGMGMIYQR